MSVTIKTTITRTVCPNCRAELAAGQRRFAPAQVRCHDCYEVLDTNLPAWDDLSAAGKVRIALLELFVPSWNTPVKAFIGNLLAWVWVSGMLGGIPAGILAVYGYGKPWGSWAPTVALIAGAIAGFVLVPLRRLLQMIGECRRYAKTGTIPIWKISSLLKSKGP